MISSSKLLTSVKLFIFVICICAFSRIAAQSKHSFALAKTDFLLDGQPYQIISGEMHPARIPKPYWCQRIQMAKAMGCNTVAAYVFWNYVEQQPGLFDFETENRNIADFIKICQEEKMWVLLRPGPYVCAEWNFGGLPAYLLQIPDIKVRCMDSRYIEAVRRYVERLSAEIKPLLVTNGGPILMVQVENEYGSYGNDRTYIETLKQFWLNNGINVPFYTADGPTPFMLEAGSLSGAAIGLDSGISDADFQQAALQNPDVPAFSSETYPGWLTHWKEQWQRPNQADILRQVKYLMDHKRSFNLYVIHGGTNFGYTAGANAFNPTQFQPDVTSYDYDAPINEQGGATSKYYALRSLIQSYSKQKLPPLPKPVQAMQIPAFELKPFTSVWSNLPKPVITPQPVPMESLGQQHGFILYRTKLTGHKSGDLTITEPHDYALILLNGKLVDTMYRDSGKWTIKLSKTTVKFPVLDILVENMGHINFAQYMIDRKGITDRVTLNGVTLMNWETFNLPMDEKQITALPNFKENLHDGIYFKGNFELKHTADTYLDVSHYQKGIVWINGHNLGRYWNTGPQHSLYCPAQWLKAGLNEVIIFDIHPQAAATVKGVMKLY